ncbi:hypothetical protein M0R19_04350 [Candidatus Pacearchaeota archaeon]|nr:hypothetical protein [Candidatus Pacearchaeota archaeon]
MGFLDNSGDIILDAVLTDTGRMRLAKGDGSFKIAKFALGDDEINYGLYDKTNSSGSAYYDLSILQTPVFEAFTNNMSSLKSKLMSIPRTNLLYLPVIQLNTIFAGSCEKNAGLNGFYVMVDKDTYDSVSTATEKKGGIVGYDLKSGGNYIRLDQGLNTTEIPPDYTLDADLLETQYILEMDSRLGSIASKDGVVADYSYIDDDEVASYFFSLGVHTKLVSKNTKTALLANTEIISGPRGTILEFTIKSSLDLTNSDYLFTTLGYQITFEGSTVYVIPTTVRITGGTTGYSTDVPVYFMKIV